MGSGNALKSSVRREHQSAESLHLTAPDTCYHFVAMVLTGAVLAAAVAAAAFASSDFRTSVKSVSAPAPSSSQSPAHSSGPKPPTAAASVHASSRNSSNSSSSSTGSGTGSVGAGAAIADAVAGGRGPPGAGADALEFCVTPEPLIAKKNKKGRRSRRALIREHWTTLLARPRKCARICDRFTEISDVILLLCFFFFLLRLLPEKYSGVNTPFLGTAALLFYSQG